VGDVGAPWKASAMPDVTLAPQRYFTLIDDDTERMLAVAEGILETPVPSCPGWSVADLVEHTGYVYLHKVRVMADGAFPTDWPPAEYAAVPPLELLRTAKDALFEEFSRHDATEQTATFGADTTIGFWARRMALEAAVHRYDAELAAADVTEIPDDLARDGVDEVLNVMLASGYGDPDFARRHPVEATVAIECGDLRWLATLDASTQVAVTLAASTTPPAPGDRAAEATVAGDPAPLFCWLWGRESDDVVRLGGDPQVLRGFRARLGETLG